MFNKVSRTFRFGDNDVTLTTGEVARQASGACVVQMGDTVVLATVVAKKEAKEGQDFFPLTVDYVEKAYAAGRFPGGFFKREGRPSEHETLTSRLIDRPIRPLFPDGFYNEVQVICTVVSADPEVDPDIPAMLGASAALQISGIPFKGPIAGCRVGYINGQYVCNPHVSQMADSKLDLVVAGTSRAVLMVESEADRLPEDVMLGAVSFGHQQMQVAIEAINSLVEEAGKPAWDWQPPAKNEALIARIRELAFDGLKAAYDIRQKQPRSEKIRAVYELVHETLKKDAEAAGAEPTFDQNEVDGILFEMEAHLVRDRILRGEPRIDGRDTRTVRPIEIRMGVLPRTHGSALFTRGETQYSLRLLPIGGYCAMEGEDEKSDDPRAFGNRPVWQRMIVVAAGGIMNILLAVLLMMVICGQEDRYATMRIAGFAENSAFEAAGVEVGDVITSIDGYTVRTGQDLSFALSMAALDSTDGTAALDLTVKRGEETVAFNDMTINTTSADGKQYRAVLDFYVLGEEKTPWTLIKNAFADTYSTVRMIFNSLIGMVTGRFGFKELAGPVGTAQAVTQAASAGLKQSFGAAVNNIVYIMLVISVNLGIVNLLPLPALDGGRLVFLIIEAIFRRPVPAKYERWVHAGGFALLICLMLAVTFQDIMRIATGG